MATEASYTAVECCNGMMDADKALYEKCLDTPGFALWWNRLGMRARAADAALAACKHLDPLLYMRCAAKDHTHEAENREWNEAVLELRAALALVREPEGRT